MTIGTLHVITWGKVDGFVPGLVVDHNSIMDTADKRDFPCSINKFHAENARFFKAISNYNNK